MQLNIILPVYNEKDSIEYVLKEWQKQLDKQKITYAFVVCEDGSIDGTKELLLQLQKKYPLKLNQKKERRGYGRAVIDGIKSSHSEYVLCIDADGQCDPEDFSTFWRNKEKAEVLIGWRTERADSFQRKLFSLLFKTIFIFLFPTTIHDPSAPFVLFKKQAIIPNVNYLRYLKEGFWWGFIGTCIKKNISIYEIPIRHRKRINGDTQVYKIENILDIALRNFLGLVQLRISK